MAERCIGLAIRKGEAEGGVMESLSRRRADVQRARAAYQIDAIAATECHDPEAVVAAGRIAVLLGNDVVVIAVAAGGQEREGEGRRRERLRTGKGRSSWGLRVRRGV